MIRPKLVLISCCAVLSGLAMFTATAAQAEVGARWLMVNSSGWVVFLEASLGLKAETSAILHTKIAGVSVLFSCSWAEAIGATLKAEGGIGKGAKVRFSNCSTLLNGAVSKPCEPKDPTWGWGSIVTNSSHGLVEYVSLTNNDVVKFLPDTGETLATIYMSEECSIGERVPVIGKVRVKDCSALALTHLVEHLVEVTSGIEGTELWVISKTVEHMATLLGSAFAYLTGAHTGMAFSADPS